MLPATLHDFMVANVGAAASFIGLLFVALTVVMPHGKMSKEIAVKDKILAEGSYIALITIFFISLVSLLPNGRVDWVLVSMGVIGTISSVRLLLRTRGIITPQLLGTFRYGSVALYIFICLFGISVLEGPSNKINLSVFYVVIFMLYIVALERAWMLIGMAER